MSRREKTKVRRQNKLQTSRGLLMGNRSVGWNFWTPRVSLYRSCHFGASGLLTVCLTFGGQAAAV